MKSKSLSSAFWITMITSGLVLVNVMPFSTVQASTNISGLISSDSTWTFTGSPYIITGDILVDANVLLNIESGVVVKFAGGTNLIVDGTLVAEGDKTHPITFKSNAESSASNDWGTINFRGSSTGSILKWVSVSYASDGVTVTSGSPTIDHCSITDNQRYGIYVSAGAPKISSSTISSNGKDGIWNYVGTITISNSTISNNKGNGIYKDSKSITIQNSVISNNLQSGIYGGAGGEFAVSNCIVSYNGRDGITICYSDLTITNSEITNNNRDGVRMESGTLSGTAKITGNKISYNSGNGVYKSSGSIQLRNNTITFNQVGIAATPFKLVSSNSFQEKSGDTLVEHNNIVDNSLYAIENVGPGTNIFGAALNLTAINNWWGTTDTALIDQLIRDIKDDFSLGRVEYVPFLNEHVSTPTPPLSNVTITDLGSWSMFHNDLVHSGYSESTGPLTNQVLWKYQAGSSIESSPSVDGGVVYFGALWNGYNGFVYALNATTGSELWQFATDSGVESSPAVVGGVVYIGSYGGHMYALNASTGTELWSFNTRGSVFPSPAVVNGTVFVGSATGYMYALNAATGNPLWSYRTSGAIFSSPAVVDGVVYFGSEDQNFYALRASDGSQIWHYTADGFIDVSPVVVNSVVYFGSRDGYVYALNATNGVKIWSFRALHGNYGSYYYSTPAVANEVVYVGSYDSSIYALNAINGSIIWDFRTGGYIFSSPIVAGTVVYVGSYDGYVYALDAMAGSKIWSYQTGGKMRSSCAIVNGTVYVGSDAGYLYAFGSSSSQSASSYKISGYILDEKGNGIEGAHITFNAPPIPSVQSGTLGYYALSAPAGVYRVNVWPPLDANYVNYDESGFVVESDITKNITLQSGYKVAGYISFSNGTPVVGAAVIFRNSANTQFGSGWFSTSKGYYFLSVPAGTYTIDAHPRTGNYYSGPTTDFPPYYEYNFTVSGNTIKNITVGFSPSTSTPNPEPASSLVSSSLSSPELSSVPPATATPTQATTSTNAATMTLLEILLSIVIIATPIVAVISVSLMFYFRKTQPLNKESI